MHAGDIFAGKQIPFLDANNGGSGVAIVDTLAKAHGTIKNVDMIITGHSTVMNMNDLAEYAQFNRDFLKAVQDGKRAGRTVDQVAGTWTIPSTYRGYVTPAAMALKRNIQVVYDELK